MTQIIMAQTKQKNEVYKCNVCGNIVEVLYVGGGELVCCNQPMELMVEKGQAEEGKEKHIPIVEKTANGVKVKVGSVPHPMEEGHYIEWVEIIADGKVYKKFLNPGDAPEAEFNVESDNIVAREYCNIHGLWRSK